MSLKPAWPGSSIHKSWHFCFYKAIVDFSAFINPSACLVIGHWTILLCDTTQIATNARLIL